MHTSILAVTFVLLIQSLDTTRVSAAPDPSPIFTEFPTNLEISEDSVLGATVTRVKAVGGDKPISYSLQDDSGWYQIDNNGAITVKSPLDREDEKYKAEAPTKLTIMATEGADGLGQANNNSTVEIFISLADVNDCAPKFSHSKYTAFVPEDGPIGRDLDFGVGVVLNVTDLDTDDNAAFNVYLQDTTDSFCIIPTNGTGSQVFSIQVKSQNFDCEGGSHTTIKVSEININFFLGPIMSLLNSYITADSRRCSRFQPLFYLHGYCIYTGILMMVSSQLKHVSCLQHHNVPLCLGTY